MVPRVKVLRRVSVRRAIAAADVTALQTEPQVHPRTIRPGGTPGSLRRSASRRESYRGASRLASSSIASYPEIDGTSQRTSSPLPETLKSSGPAIRAASPAASCSPPTVTAPDATKRNAYRPPATVFASAAVLETCHVRGRILPNRGRRIDARLPGRDGSHRLRRCSSVKSFCP